jgi:hypothetical protein
MKLFTLFLFQPYFSYYEIMPCLWCYDPAFAPVLRFGFIPPMKVIMALQYILNLYWGESQGNACVKVYRVRVYRVQLDHLWHSGLKTKSTIAISPPCMFHLFFNKLSGRWVTFKAI